MRGCKSFLQEGIWDNAENRFDDEEGGGRERDGSNRIQQWVKNILGQTKVASLKSQTQLTHLNIPFPFCPKPPIQQVQEELEKEETWAENTSGSLELDPNFGLVLAVKRSLKGNSQWDLVEL